MVVNYLKVAYRILLKHKAYTIANVVGLGIGIAATLLILSYLEFEYSYDGFHANKDRLYRVSVKERKGGKIESDSPVFTPPIGPAMARDFPEVENYVRLSTPRVAYLSSDHQAFRITDIVYGDSTMFDLFSFQLIAGDLKRALVEPYSIVLTEENATLLFGDNNPIDRLIKVNGGYSYRVTGIVKAPPANSHIQFKALMSFSTLDHDPNIFLDWNGGNQYIAYVRLRPYSRPQDVESRFPALMWENINHMLAPLGVSLEPYLQPLTDIHLYYSQDSDTTRTNIRIFGMIALFVLFIACVNFINLATARASRRAKEVGIRKVLGANKPMLVRQFLSESMLISLLGSLMALFLVELFIPVYGRVISEDITQWTILDAKTMLGLFAIVVIVGVVAGSYPSFYLSSLQATRSLKNGVAMSGTSGRLRSLLIVLQFGISIALIVCTVLVGQQLSHLHSVQLGFNKENVVVLPLIGDDAKMHIESLKKEILRLPGIAGASASSDVPISGFTSNGYFPQGQKVPMMVHVVDVDEDFLTTFGIGLSQGRNFSSASPSEKTAYLINECLARTLTWEDPIGKTITRNGDHSVIGVVKDFNFATLHSHIEPLIITHNPWRGRYDDLSVKMSSVETRGTLSAIQDVWKRIVPTAPFSYWFLDESFNHLYEAEGRFEKMFLAFSSLAIFIALMGLLSLVSFATEQRTKEIGIRRILGASVLSITTLFSKQYLRLVILANIVAWPMAYYFITLWLQDFAYRIHVGWWPFALSGLITLVLGGVTVGIQTLRAALSNSVESLRYE